MDYCLFQALSFNNLALSCYHLSLNLCGRLSVRIIIILRQLIALELVLFPHDSFRKETEAVRDESGGEQRGKVLMQGLKSGLWGYAVWMRVSDVCFLCNTSNLRAAINKPS